MRLFQKIRFYLLYFGTPPWDTGKSPPELHSFIHKNPPGRALDLGCGTGTNVITLAKNNWDVTGVDYIAKAIHSARKKAVQTGVKANLFVDDVTSLEKIEGPFDLILDIGCFHNFTKNQKRNYIHTIHKLIAPGGTYLLYALLHSKNGGPSRGIDDDDINAFKERFILSNQELGLDRNRPSCWLTFTNSQMK